MPLPNFPNVRDDSTAPLPRSARRAPPPKLSTLILMLCTIRAAPRAVAAGMPSWCKREEA